MSHFKIFWLLNFNVFFFKFYIFYFMLLKIIILNNCIANLIYGVNRIYYINRTKNKQKIKCEKLQSEILSWLQLLPQSTPSSVLPPEPLCSLPICHHHSTWPPKPNVNWDQWPPPLSLLNHSLHPHWSTQQDRAARLSHFQTLLSCSGPSQVCLHHPVMKGTVSPLQDLGFSVRR